MKLRLSDKASKVLQFEAKLLVGVAVLGTIVYFSTNALIYTAAAKVAEAYTGEFFK